MRRLAKGAARGRYAFLAFFILVGLHRPSLGQQQEGQSVEFVTHTDVVGYKLPSGEYLFSNVRLGGQIADHIRDLRKVPKVKSEGEPTSLIIEKYLHKHSQAIETQFCYLESDWLSVQELTVAAAVGQKVMLVTQNLFKNKSIGPFKGVITKRQEEYLALIDAWAESERVKKQARHAGHMFVGSYRCAYRDTFLDVLTLVSADSVLGNLEQYFRKQEALSQGLHTFVTGIMGLGYEHYIALDVTTPVTVRDLAIRQLFEIARDYLSHPKRDTLEMILRCELNDLNPERLSVAVALVHFMLETEKDHWNCFLATLKRESSENGKLKGPEGRWSALLTAIKEAFGMGLKELDQELQRFASTHYLYPEEIAKLIGVDRDTDESSFEGYVKICELKRKKGPVSEKGEKLFQAIQDRVQKKILANGEKF